MEFSLSSRSLLHSLQGGHSTAQIGLDGPRELEGLRKAVQGLLRRGGISQSCQRINPLYQLSDRERRLDHIENRRPVLCGSSCAQDELALVAARGQLQSP